MSVKNKSCLPLVREAHRRNLVKVPFVELADGKLQGVTSSGSDITRVYVSFFKKGNHNYYCSTNNNRPCGGLRGSPCKHLCNLLDEAVNQFGLARVTQYLGLEIDSETIKKGSQLVSVMSGVQENEPAAIVFSRFLNHLSYLELPPHNEPVPELDYFFMTREENNESD